MGGIRSFSDSGRWNDVFTIRKETMEKILLLISQIADKNQREVVIPEGYTKIGDGAFRYCASLEKVVIPDSVTEIGEGAFRGCPWSAR